MNSERPRVREVGIRIGDFLPGKHNAITDVGSVIVGHATIIKDQSKQSLRVGPVRTGVTAILPHTRNIIEEPVEASCFVFNGAGTTAGLPLIEEFGLIETPILLTTTLSVGIVYDAVVQYVIKHSFRDKKVRWFNPVVGETCDGYLNEIGKLHVKAEHVFKALDSAKGGYVEEGNVGAGTGTGALGFKAGLGTSSRKLEIGGSVFTVGVLVQSNFEGSLTIQGVPVGKTLGKGAMKHEGGGSIMVIVATDAPLSHRQLTRLVKRVTLGLARTGWTPTHGSGDYFIGFSTSFRSIDWSTYIRTARETIVQDEKSLNPLFEATADATEEAILNSLFKAETMKGRNGNVYEELPIQQVLQILEKYGRL
jgi:D-aminopeptidase